jgi:hypothetical protein
MSTCPRVEVLVLDGCPNAEAACDLAARVVDRRAFRATRDEPRRRLGAIVIMGEA